MFRILWARETRVVRRLRAVWNEGESSCGCRPPRARVRAEVRGRREDLSRACARKAVTVSSRAGVAESWRRLVLISHSCERRHRTQIRLRRSLSFARVSSHRAGFRRRAIRLPVEVWWRSPALVRAERPGPGSFWIPHPKNQLTKVGVLKRNQRKGSPSSSDRGGSREEGERPFGAYLREESEPLQTTLSYRIPARRNAFQYRWREH